MAAKTRRGSASFISNAGVRVYQPGAKQGKASYWRISWTEEGRRRDTSAKDYVAAMSKAAEIDRRLASENGERSLLTGDELIDAYLDPAKRRIAGRKWGPSHAADQAHIMSKYVRPILGTIPCSQITNKTLRSVIASTPTYSVAKHVTTAVKGLISWGELEGWIVVPVRPMLAGLKNEMDEIGSPKKARRAGESSDHIQPSEIPDHAAVSRAAAAAADITGYWWYELLFLLAAYSGLRLGEIFDLSIDQVDLKNRRIEVNYQCLEVGGKKSRSLPKYNKSRTTVFPTVTPEGYELLEKLTQRMMELKKIKTPLLADGTTRSLLFSDSRGQWLSHSSFGAKVRRPAQEIAGWPVDNGRYRWNFQSLRHVFCSYYLGDLEKDPRDVSIAAGHRDVSTTLTMYIGASKGALNRLTKE